MPHPDAEDIMSIWEVVEGLRPVRDPASIAELLRYVADELAPNSCKETEHCEGLPHRPMSDAFEVQLHDGFLKILAKPLSDGVEVPYDQLPALVSVLQDIASDMVGHS